MGLYTLVFNVLLFRLTVELSCPASSPPAQYVNGIPQGLNGASSIQDCSQSPAFVPAINRGKLSAKRFPFPSNKWFSGLFWKRCLNVQTTTPAYMFPLAVSGIGNGLVVSCSQEDQVFTSATYSFLKSFKYTFEPHDLMVTSIGTQGDGDGEPYVLKYSDLHVALGWYNNNVKYFSATIARGSPFIVFDHLDTSRQIQITTQGSINIWNNQPGCLAFSLQTFRGPSIVHNYAIYSDPSVTWTYQTQVDSNGAPQSIITSNMNGKKSTFSLAALSSNAMDEITFLKDFSLTKIINSRVIWSYQKSNSVVKVSYKFVTLGDKPVFLLLLPHHQANLDPSIQKGLVSGVNFNSARGKLVGFDSTKSTINGFCVNFNYPGLLPVLSINPSSTDIPTIKSDITAIANLDPDIYLPTSDSYWEGKALGKVADLVLIADQLQMNNERDIFLGALKNKLNQWFSGNPSSPSYFYYDKNWGSLIGNPASYGSDTDLNDHHFHYGYFIKASAVVSMFDETWMVQNCNNVNLLVRDVASPNRDAMFPRTRNFDHFVSHSYASGHAAFGSGNNQESSSEAMNFNTALILWGSVSNQRDIENLGIYYYSAENEAIKNYWFNVNGNNFPEDFGYPYCSLFWDDGGSHEIFWGPPTPEELQGINLLPVTSTSLYLGEYSFDRYYNHMISLKGGSIESVWVDIIWMWQSIFDPSTASEKMKANMNYQPEPGTTRPFTMYFLNANYYLGKVKYEVKCDAVFCLAFDSGVYVVYNPSSSPMKVRFSDGKSVMVEGQGLGMYN